ncbi:MAG TPA: DUF4276 family protein [Aggregatilineales bacterium]|nr:DUF4276 family protein [Aggregatilineales bacterium]
MKVGLIVEGLADIRVCEHFIRQFAPDVTFGRSVSLINKPKLIANCGESASILLEQGCERVVIIWDLYPPWGEKGEKPCRKEDREAILDSLKKASVPPEKVFLVCIENELETWLLYDMSAIEQLLSRPTYPVRLKKLKRPQEIPSPKSYLMRLFKQHGREYTDYEDAIKIARNINISRLRKCETFVRFALKVADIKLS